MFAQGFLEHISGNDTKKLIVLYDTKIQGHKFNDINLHEEADTLIPHHILASANDKLLQDICIWSPATDVFISLLNLVSSGHFVVQTHLKFCKAAKYRYVSIWC